MPMPRVRLGGDRMVTGKIRLRHPRRGVRVKTDKSQGRRTVGRTATEEDRDIRDERAARVTEVMERAERNRVAGEAHRHGANNAKRR